MSTIDTYVAATLALLERCKEGVAAIGQEAAKPAPVPGTVQTSLPNEKALFDVLRQMLGGKLSVEQVDTIHQAIARALLPADHHRALPSIGLTPADYEWAAKRLGWSVPQIRAVDLVESAGGGWFTDIRASILSLDGDGGFLDGNALPKILYEAHVFARNTDPAGKFNATAPNLSSAKWNKSLYVGGQGEYARLWKAIALDRDAAFKAISVGRYQILGENHTAAGFGSAESFFEAMCVSERAHLEAFVTFIVNSGLVEEGRAISADAGACTPFAKGYNGSQAVANGYPEKLAREYAAALKS
jgi:hypothetical protein